MKSALLKITSSFCLAGLIAACQSTDKILQPPAPIPSTPSQVMQTPVQQEIIVEAPIPTTEPEVVAQPDPPPHPPEKTIEEPVQKPEPTAAYQPSEMQQITYIGENSQAKWFGSDDKIIFVSAERPSHEKHQIYLMNLTTKRQARIGFQNAQMHTPLYASENSFFYSSSMDEDKEELDPQTWMLETNKDKVTQLNTYPFSATENLEIYKATLDGRRIQRLTENRGYDAELTIHPQKQYLIYTTKQKNSFQIFRKDLKSGKAYALTKGEWHNSQPSYSKSGNKVAWISYDKNFENSQINVSSSFFKDGMTLSFKGRMAAQPTWHPDEQGLVFALQSLPEKNFDLYSLEIESKCLKRLTYEKTDSYWPDFNSTGSELLLTSLKSGKKQIYKMKYAPPSSCEDSLQ